MKWWCPLHHSAPNTTLPSPMRSHHTPSICRLSIQEFLDKSNRLFSAFYISKSSIILNPHSGYWEAENAAFPSVRDSFRSCVSRFWIISPFPLKADMTNNIIFRAKSLVVLPLRDWYLFISAMNIITEGKIKSSGRHRVESRISSLLSWYFVAIHQPSNTNQVLSYYKINNWTYHLDFLCFLCQNVEGIFSV